MGLGILALFIANFAGGAVTPLFVKLGVGEIPPVTFTVLRFAIALFAVLPFFLLQKGAKFAKGSYKLILLNSLFFTINVVLFSIAMQYTGAVMGQILYAFVPIIVAFLAHFMLDEKITRNKLLGSVIAFAGLVFLLDQSLGNQDIFGKPLGNLLLMVGVLSWSFYLILSRKITKHTSVVSLNTANFAVAAILLTLLIPFELSMRPFSVENISNLGLASLIITGAFSSALVMTLVQYGIKKTGAFIASLFMYLGPLAAAVTAVPFLGEKITFNLTIGAALILFGVFYATTYAKLKRNG